MTNPVGLASIGLGWWGNVLADAAASGGKAEVVACYARTAETREEFASKHGCKPAGSLEEIWQDPSVEGVLLATPHAVRQELIAQAAAAGKHIFVEKPLALTGAEARASARAAEAGGVLLQVGHNKRRQTGNRRLHEMLHPESWGNSSTSRPTSRYPLPSSRTCPSGGRAPSRSRPEA